MNPKELPLSPSLEQYKKQAKDLVKAHKAGRHEAIQRIQQHHPRAAQLSEVALADAQLVIAREHGFDSWPKFAVHITSLKPDDPAFLWKSAEEAVIKGDLAALDHLLREHPKMFREQHPPSFASGGLRPDYSGGDAQAILLSNHHFENWNAFAKYLEALNNPTSPIAQFEEAVYSIVNGDTATLERLLHENPDLTQARSPRKHYATLLHYVGSNGVEYFRQKCPKNIVAITKMLLQAGADVDAVADIYGKSTTFGLAATSIHPVLAGVLIPLLETLLAAGATMDAPAGTGSLVNACLHNGRAAAAEFLALRGARLDLEAASGVGRLDLVKNFFHDDGSLKPTATKTQLNDGFCWACQYGRLNVVEFLLDQRFDITANGAHGQTGLHWAAYGGHLDIVKLLLKQKPLIDVKDKRFQSTPLGWAIHGWQSLPVEAAGRRYSEVIALLFASGAKVEPEWLTDEKVRHALNSQSITG
jgi:Ankyrin repeats (3 copies)